MITSAVEIEALARKAWGDVNEPMSTRRKHELRFGSHGSKALCTDTGMWFDHEAGAGGGYRALYKLACGRYPEPNGHDPAGELAFRVTAEMVRELGQPVGWWDYHDAKGNTVGRVLRFEPAERPKEYRQCKPTPQGWRWKMDGLQLPPYRLPSLLAAPDDAVVYLTEGEKQADALRGWGLTATTNAGGAGKFLQHHARALSRHNVIVLGDNDDAGRKHVDKVMRELQAAKVRARVLSLPGLPHKGDVLDWMAAGGMAEALADLVSRAVCSPDDPKPDLEAASDESEDDLEAEIQLLAALPIVRYERLRQDTAKRLKVRAGFLDRMVQQARGTSDDAQQGKPLELLLPEAWPQPVDGAKLLLDLAEYFTRHAFLPHHASTTLALWTVHTYCFELFEHTPRLHIRAIAKNSGKTTVLDLLEAVVCRPLPTAHVTSSVLFRVIDLAKPTLLIDEADTFIREAEEVRGIINAGHKKGQQVLRTVGDNYEPRAFSVFSPIAIAGIGNLPGTIADRSINIEMRRAMKHEMPSSITKQTRSEATELGRRAVRWTLDHEDKLDGADPDMGELFNRMADNWRALFAVADAVGEDWPDIARKTASALTVVDDDTETTAVKLLADIREVFTVEDITSIELVNKLLLLEGRPWPELGRDRKPLTTNMLARLLTPFRINPGFVGPEEARLRGYKLSAFADAFGRNLPPMVKT